MRLCRVSDQQKANFTVADQRVKQSKRDLRNVLHFIDDHGGVVSFRLFALEAQPVRQPDQLGRFHKTARRKCLVIPRIDSENGSSLFQR